METTAPARTPQPEALKKRGDTPLIGTGMRPSEWFAAGVFTGAILMAALAVIMMQLSR